MDRRRSYLDVASAAPLHPVARQALLAALDDGWADPARLSTESRRAGQLLDAAREVVAAEIGARPDEVTFCANGTQAVHLGVLGVLAGRRARAGRRFVHSAIEHSSVLHAADWHVAAGGDASQVGVDRAGLVDAGVFGAALDGAAAGALMSANHEVGTVQPVDELDLRGVPLVVDAAQSLGRVDLPRQWSVLTGSAHKWGGPPGVGVLAVRKGTRWSSPYPADERERGRAPGSGNIPAIVAAAASLRAVAADRSSAAERLSALVDRIRERVPATIPDVEVVGHPRRRLPHLVTFSVLYVDGEALVHALDAAGFAVSSGSSCTSSTVTPSHVLAAMGVLTHGNVRISLPADTTGADVERFLAVLPDVVADLRATAGVRGL